jgi:transcriptional regulator with XRE-family HTH domain
MSTETIGDKLRSLREEKELPLRKVAALLDIDVAILSKMERGERPLSKDVVSKLAKIYEHDEEELTVLFLSQKIVDEVGEEELALKAMQVAEEQIKYQRKKHK